MSSVDVFEDRRMLTNIRTVSRKMRIACNAGEVVVTQMGDLKKYGPVWYYPGAIANIFSLSNVKKCTKCATTVTKATSSPCTARMDRSRNFV